MDSDLAAVARRVLAGSAVAVASAATAFPSGGPLAVELADVAAAVEAGADEMDMVIDRATLLTGRYARERPPEGGPETGELAALDNVARASLAGHAGQGRLHQDLDRQALLVAGSQAACLTLACASVTCALR